MTDIDTEEKINNELMVGLERLTRDVEDVIQLIKRLVILMSESFGDTYDIEDYIRGIEALESILLINKNNLNRAKAYLESSASCANAFYLRETLNCDTILNAQVSDLDLRSNEVSKLLYDQMSEELQKVNMSVQRNELQEKQSIELSTVVTDGQTVDSEEIEKNLPPVRLQKVEFSAIAPKTLLKGNYSILHVVMYEEAFRHIVDDLIRNSNEPTQEERSGLHKVTEGDKVKIILSSPNISIDDNLETGIWQGKHLDFSFAVFLPDDYINRQILFFAKVYINDVPATKLKFIAGVESPVEQKLAIEREDVLSAFVSYASQDRKQVAAIIQGMKTARPDLDVFFDVDSLRSGDRWEQSLYQEIEKRDILFLCWSHFARDSHWVNAEWRYALEHKGEESIEPVPIESPEQCPPPQELKHKHFNDKLLYIINAG